MLLMEAAGGSVGESGGDTPVEEIVDAFDVAGTFVRRVERSVVMRPEATGLYGRSGHVLLAREREGTVRFAITIRSRRKKNWPNCYDFTAGGMAVAGESELDATVRETCEELGILLDREQLQELVRMSPACGYHSFGAVYACIWNAPLSENPEEVEAILWFSSDELTQLRYSGRPMKPDLLAYIESLTVI